MINIKNMFVVMVCMSIVACASKPQMQTPPKTPLNDTVSIYREAALDRVDHVGQHLNGKKDIMYIQNFGGGGVGLGLLAGPLGVAANIKMIKNRTLEEVGKLKDKLPFDVSSMFSESLGRNNITIKSDASFKVNPYILVERINEKQISIAAAAFIDNQPNIPGKYLAQLPDLYNLETLSNLSDSQLTKINADLSHGFDEIIQMMKKESSADVLAEKKVLVKSEFLSPRIMFEIQANVIEETNDSLWIRTVGLVAKIQKSGAEIKPVKK